MIKLENYEVVGWEHAIRGMRNPLNSWERSDSLFESNSYPVIMECDLCPHKETNCALDAHIHCMNIGKNDHELMMRLAHGGPVHAKYRRMITVYVDITAPLYWWKEFDTYKVGTVANSCSTMHKIHAKEFTREDFSFEHLIFDEWDIVDALGYTDNSSISPDILGDLTIEILNIYRNKYLQTKDKKYWWQMIQLLPSSYNQKRTVMLNYEVLTNIYEWRKDHKLDEWHAFCDWIKQLPYSEIITGPADRIAEGEAGLGPKGPEGLKSV